MATGSGANAPLSPVVVMGVQSDDADGSDGLAGGGGGGGAGTKSGVRAGTGTDGGEVDCVPMALPATAPSAPPIPDHMSPQQQQDGQPESPSLIHRLSSIFSADQQAPGGPGENGASR
jgi:hypothetical protein